MSKQNISSIRRISDIRKGRIERQLANARTAFASAKSLREKAECQVNIQDQIARKASDESYIDPSLEQGWIWRAATFQQREQAAEQAQISVAAEQEQKIVLSDAGRAFQKARVKAEHLTELERKDKSTAQQRIDEIASEELQDAQIIRSRLS